MAFYDVGGFSMLTTYGNLERVAFGTFGHVYRAQVQPGAIRENNRYFAARTLDAPVVIKRLSKDRVEQDPYHAKQAFREIFLLKQLRHDNIVKLVDVFESPERDIFIVTEAMNCELSRIIGPQFQWQEQYIPYVIYGILRGLKYIHSAGVIHRDLKPANIIINTALDVRICDFGLARPADPQMAKTGYVTTRYYRAPEVLLTWQNYGTALDVWSAGCILAEIINCFRKQQTMVRKDPKTGAEYPCYAIFPADRHVDNLVKIIQVLGPPSPAVIENISDPSVKSYILSKTQELQGRTTTIWSYMHGFDQQAVGLLELLLAFDPQGRISAERALEHTYLRGYHDPEDEPAAMPINRDFEKWDIDKDAWHSLIQQELLTLAPQEPQMPLNEIAFDQPVELDLPDLPDFPNMDLDFMNDLTSTHEQQLADLRQSERRLAQMSESMSPSDPAAGPITAQLIEIRNEISLLEPQQFDDFMLPDQDFFKS